jgi:hypothetical protein
MTVTNEPDNKNKWIWIGLGAALLFCCCAVLAAYLVFRQAGQTLQDGMKTDPESAAQAAHKIADYDLPPGYQEQMSMDILFYSFVIIAPDTDTQPTTSPLIMLAQFSQTGMDREQMEQQLRQAFEQQSGQRGADMQVVEVKNMVIRGEEVEVTIFEGTDTDGYVMRQLITSFPGKDGTAMLMIMGSPSAWDDNMIDDFIESIH